MTIAVESISAVKTTSFASITVGAANDVIVVLIYNSDGMESVTGVTWEEDSGSFTWLEGMASARGNVEAYGLVNPAVGTNNITLEGTLPTNTRWVAIVLSGVNNADAWGDTNSNSCLDDIGYALMTLEDHVSYTPAANTYGTTLEYTGILLQDFGCFLNVLTKKQPCSKPSDATITYNVAGTSNNPGETAQLIVTHRDSLNNLIAQYDDIEHTIPALGEAYNWTYNLTVPNYSAGDIIQCTFGQTSSFGWASTATATATIVIEQVNLNPFELALNTSTGQLCFGVIGSNSNRTITANGTEIDVDVNYGFEYKGATGTITYVGFDMTGVDGYSQIAFAVKPDAALLTNIVRMIIEQN